MATAGVHSSLGKLGEVARPMARLRVQDLRRPVREDSAGKGEVRRTWLGGETCLGKAYPFSRTAAV